MRVYRQTYTTKPPASATWTTRGVKRCATWTARGGKKITGEETDNGRVRVKITDCWYYEIYERDGVWRQHKGVADKSVTEKAARKAQVTEDEIRLGVSTPAAASGSAKAMFEHLADFISYLRARDNTPVYVAGVESHLNEAIANINPKSVADFTPAAAIAWVDSVRSSSKSGAPLPKGAKPRLGPTSCNHRLRALKSFCEWMVTEARADRNPMLRVEYYDEKSDVRRRRRSITDAEFKRLLAVAEASKPERVCRNHAPFGYDRVVLYTLAAYTGFRVSELASLTPGSFDLDGNPPTVTVSAAYSKRRRRDVIPLPDWLVGDLREYLDGQPKDRRVWPGKWHRRATKFLFADLVAAKIPLTDDHGRVVDFHSLRRTYITSLIRAGVSPKVAQQLARHSSISLTMDIYADAEIHERAAAANSLPKPG